MVSVEGSSDTIPLWHSNMGHYSITVKNRAYVLSNNNWAIAVFTYPYFDTEFIVGFKKSEQNKAKFHPLWLFLSGV
jgi:hypothetical protein